MLKKVSAKWVLGFDGVDHTLIEDGEVLFDGGSILHVGPRSDRPADEVHECGKALIAPGFVDLNALADVDTTILGFGGETSRDAKGWSRDYAENRRREVLGLGEQVASARFAFAQLLLSGITTALPVTSLLFRSWAETGAEFRAIAGLSDELGIRLVLGPSYRSAVNVMDVDGTIGQVIDEAAGAAGLAEAIAFVRHCRTLGDLVSGLLVPSTIETCSDALLLATAEAARDLGVPFRLHCCQSLAEAELVWQRSGLTSIGHLGRLGILSGRALLPHAIELGGPDRDPVLVEADIVALAASGATVVHCPLVVGRGGRRLESFPAFRERGISIGLGTDTAPPDMLMNLQMGLAMARITGKTALADLYRAATIQAANAIGRGDLGRLEPGACADIVVWDLSSLSAQPVFDPVAALFLMPPCGRATHVFVGGRHCVADGAVIGFDAERAVGDVEAIVVKLLASFRERTPQDLSSEALFPPAFKPNTAGRPAA